MSVPSRQFCRLIRPSFSRSCSLHPKRASFLTKRPCPVRAISTTFRLREDDYTGALPDPSEYRTPEKPITPDELDAEARTQFDSLSKEEQESWLAQQNHMRALIEEPESDEDLDRTAIQTWRTLERDEENVLDFRPEPFTKRDQGFWAEDMDEDESAQVEDDDDDAGEGDITSMAHAELDLHREIREYTRITAWEMPMLAQFAKPFEPPTNSTPLRFRYTTYLGEHHPAARKVVIQFNPDDLPDLTDQQRQKLIKLVGPRYNPEFETVRMSCEKFEEPAQNKRYLGDLVNNLIKEAKDSLDTFEDIPLDFRHHKPKRRTPDFPEEWKIKPETVQQLLSQREQRLLGDPKTPLDGKVLVEAHVKALRIPLRAPVAAGRVAGRVGR